MSAYIYIIGMCLITAAIRILPLLIFRRPIRNRFLRSFFYYVPYVTLAVMTFPDIIHTTMTPVSGVVALIVGIVAAWFGLRLFPVAAICCAVTYLIEHFI